MDNTRKIIRICYAGKNETVVFAVDELVKYLRKMTGSSVVKVSKEKYSPDESALWVGTYEDFKVLPKRGSKNHYYDDEIKLSVKKSKGFIAGVNNRSVLIASYKFLEVLGCRWIRPDKDGEYIPQIEDIPDVELDEVPEYRHRGICMEGCSSYEDVLNIIDWSPKVGLNSYFIQYFEGYLFLKRWYGNQEIPGEQEVDFPIKIAEEFAANIISEIKKRDLLFHYVGHGWTCLPLGIPPELWDVKTDMDLTDKVKYMAEFGGKRELYAGIPRRTNLCYSREDVRQMVASEIADFVENHPETDYLHFWLADGRNHYCECSECVKNSPIDYYVMMINLVDEYLTKKKNNTKVVFLVYMDTLWPPEKETIKNPDRAVLMYAPLARSVFERYDIQKQYEPIREFELNQNRMTGEGDLNYLYQWMKLADLDSFMFDYRFMWDYHNDPGAMVVSKDLAQDIRFLKEIKVNGIISCQSQRIFFPTGLPMYTMARYLWNSGQVFDVMSDEYFKAAFGEGWKLCKEYMLALSDSIPPINLGEYMWNSKAKRLPDISEKAIEGYSRAKIIIKGFMPVIERNLDISNECHKRSWEILKYHAGIWAKLAEAFYVYAKGDQEKAIDIWADIKKEVLSLEKELHQVLDIYWFVKVMELKIKMKRPAVTTKDSMSEFWPDAQIQARRDDT